MEEGFAPKEESANKTDRHRTLHSEIAALPGHLRRW